MKLYLNDEFWEVNTLRHRDEIALVTPHSAQAGRAYKDYRFSSESARMLGEQLIRAAEELEGPEIRRAA